MREMVWWQCGSDEEIVGRGLEDGVGGCEDAVEGCEDGVEGCEDGVGGCVDVVEGCDWKIVLVK